MPGSSNCRIDDEDSRLVVVVRDEGGFNGERAKLAFCIYRPDLVRVRLHRKSVGRTGERQAPDRFELLRNGRRNGRGISKEDGKQKRDVHAEQS